jgi:hypothetical protein
MDRLGRVKLTCIGSRSDVEKYREQLHVGDFVILYEPRAFEVKAVLDFVNDEDDEGIWVASPIWSTAIEY